MKTKIQIKSIFGKLIFEYEKEDNTIKETLLEAIKSGANLSGANLSYANLRGANLIDADLSDADLIDADLSGANLIGANLRGADLIDANLRGANLSGANLSYADLSDADLIDANLRGANLRGANLIGANLRGADLSDADLIDANLRGANLRGANLRGADLSDADLSDANLSEYKKDMFDVLLRAIPEIPNLKKAISEGKIDGSTYSGECACLCGTLEKTHNPAIERSVYDIRDSSRPIEMFFASIRPGDTPENNQFAKLAVGWVEEFESYLEGREDLK